MLQILKDFERRINKERTQILSQLNYKYMHYINTLLQQKLLISREINEQYDQQLRAIRDLISNTMTNQYNNRMKAMKTEHALCNDEDNKHENAFTFVGTSNRFKPTLRPQVSINCNNTNISQESCFQPFVTHMTIQEALKLSINDRIDHRDFVGHSIRSIVIDKKDTNLKIHYIGWHKNWDEWSDFKHELHRFAKYESISRREKHMFLSLKIGDYIDIKQICTRNEWKIGEVVEFDEYSGQVKIMYISNANNPQYQWSHLDNENEIQPLQTKQLSKQPNITHTQFIENNNKQKIESNQYHCIYCNNSFKQYDILRNHIKYSHSKERQHICSYCPVAMRNKNSLEFHIMQHQRNGYYKCDFCYPLFGCRTSFVDKQHLSYHHTKMHCNEITNTNPIALQKSATHKQPKSFLPCAAKQVTITKKSKMCYHCIYCTNTFNNYSSLRTHTKNIHLKPESFLCSYCPATCVHEISLQKHTLQHTEHRPFVCNVCQQLFKCHTSFPTKASLGNHRNRIHKMKRHVVISTFGNRGDPSSIKHPGIYAYYCAHCKNSSRSFENFEKLMKHLEIVHSSMYAFICGNCAHSFSSEAALNAHMKQHKRDGDYVCDICPQLFQCKTSFDIPGSLTDHKRRLHRVYIKTKMNKSGEKRQICPSTPCQPRKKKYKKWTKSMLEKTQHAKNKEIVLNSEIWKLWKKKQKEIRAEFADQSNKLGLNPKLKKEIKKFVFENGLCKQSDWLRSWDSYTFVLTESLLLDLCIKNLQNA